MTSSPDNWLQFETRVSDWTQSSFAARLTCKHGRQAIPGYPSNGFRADALVTDGRVLIAIEIEVKQHHPDTNVGKYWLLAKHRQYERVILFHIYTPGYNSYPWRKTLAEFYAAKMVEELPFEYVLIDLRRKDTDIEAAFSQVTELITEHVQREFPC
jgi:hypothetical protein